MSPPAPRQPGVEPRRGRRRTTGLRREVAILLPTCLVLLVALSTYTLFSYRAAVERLVEERRAEALRTARALAAEVAGGGGSPDATTLARLRRLSPAVAAVAWVDETGSVRWAEGQLASLPPDAGEGDPSAPGSSVVGPAGGPPASIVAFAPLPATSGGGSLRVDLPAPLLANQLSLLRILTAVVLTVGVGVVLLSLLFLRHLMAPYDALLARARELGETDDEDDEIGFLVRTFESGMAALATAHEGAADSDLVTLQRALGNSMESGLLLLDREARVLALNPLGAEILGIRSPAPGVPLSTVLADHPDLLALLGRAMESGQGLQRREIELAGDEGRTLGLTLHPLRRAPGAPEAGTAADVRGFLVLFADLTETRRRAEESRLADSLVRLGELTAGIAHELRNSLATLRGHMTLLERTPDRREASLLEMRREADHVQRVLDDFLLFAHPGSLRLETLRLGTLLARAIADPALTGTEVRLRPDPLENAALPGDGQLLERALRNVLHNAAEAARGKAGPEVETVVDVTLHRDGETVEIVVDDHGPGLPPELREDLFTPFVSGRPGGVGLGLSLAQRIVVLHGGSIALENRPGGGARARLRLPLGRIVTEGN